MRNNYLLSPRKHSGVLKGQFGLSFGNNTAPAFGLNGGMRTAPLNTLTNNYSGNAATIGTNSFGGQTHTFGGANSNFDGTIAKNAPTIMGPKAADVDIPQPNGSSSGMSPEALGAVTTTVTNAALQAGDALVEHNREDDFVDKFGLVAPDEKYIRNKSALGGAKTGAQTGAAIGTAIMPGIGTAIGAVGGALFGGGAGAIFGNKKADKAALAHTNAYSGAQYRFGKSQTRAADLARAAALTAKLGTKMYTPSKTLIGGKPIIFKSGGSMSVGQDKSVIAKGMLHKENNNLGKKDKGIPVIDSNNKKIYELEKEELILTSKKTEELEKLALDYNENSTPEVLEKIGKVLAHELANNTVDNSGKYKS